MESVSLTVFFVVAAYPSGARRIGGFCYAVNQIVDKSLSILCLPLSRPLSFPLYRYLALCEREKERRESGELVQEQERPQNRGLAEINRSTLSRREGEKERTPPILLFSPALLAC